MTKRRLFGLFKPPGSSREALLGDPLAPTAESPSGENEQGTNSADSYEERGTGNQGEDSEHNGDRQNPFASPRDEEHAHDNGERSPSSASQRFRAMFEPEPPLQSQKSAYGKSQSSSGKTSIRVLPGSPVGSHFGGNEEEESPADSSTPSQTGEEVQAEETV